MASLCGQWPKKVDAQHGYRLRVTTLSQLFCYALQAWGMQFTEFKFIFWIPRIADLHPNIWLNPAKRHMSSSPSITERRMGRFNIMSTGTLRCGQIEQLEEVRRYTMDNVLVEASGIKLITIHCERRVLDYGGTALEPSLFISLSRSILALQSGLISNATYRPVEYLHLKPRIYLIILPPRQRRYLLSLVC